MTAPPMVSSMPTATPFVRQPQAQPYYNTSLNGAGNGSSPTLNNFSGANSSSSTSSSPWSYLLPMATTFAGTYYLNKMNPNAMRDALYASGLAGIGNMMYRYAFAPAVTSYSTGFPLSIPPTGGFGFRDAASYPGDDDYEYDNDDNDDNEDVLNVDMNPTRN